MVLAVLLHLYRRKCLQLNWLRIHRRKIFFLGRCILVWLLIKQLPLKFIHSLLEGRLLRLLFLQLSDWTLKATLLMRRRSQRAHMCPLRKEAVQESLLILHLATVLERIRSIRKHHLFDRVVGCFRQLQVGVFSYLVLGDVWLSGPFVLLELLLQLVGCWNRQWISAWVLGGSLKSLKGILTIPHWDQVIAWNDAVILLDVGAIGLFVLFK